MSSHHIVRDEQEPALLVLDATASAHELLAQLLEWSPVVLTVDEAVGQLLKQQIKVDVAVFSDQLPEQLASVLEEQRPIRIYQEQGQNALTFIFSELLKGKHKAVNLLLSTKQLDELATSLPVLSAQIDLVVFTENRKISLIRSKSFEKWMVAGTKVSFPYGLPLSMQNLQTTEDFQQYQVIENGFVKIALQGASLWIAEELQGYA